MSNLSESKVTLVTVTYGRRWHLLRRALTAAFAGGIERAIIVNNASENRMDELAHHEFGDTVRVISLPVNTGSAKGYKIGIEEALRTGAEYVWMLDDDNMPQPGALEALLCIYQKMRLTLPLDGFALVSFRPDHHADIAAGIPLRRCYPRPGSFFGFHLLDIPYKFWRRTPWGKPKQPIELPDFLPVPFAPYSGFFCHRSVIDRIGLPNAQMVLYADDTEFTFRLTLSGGHIFLIPGSLIVDLETSWNIKSRFSFTFLGWLCGGGDLRAFYGARNQAYFESKVGTHETMRAFNKGAYLGILTIAAVVKGRIARLKLLLRAVRHGEACKLGINDGFPLP